jgi:flagellar basal-body rod modification protein FlgD
MNIQGFTPSIAAPQSAGNASSPRAATNTGTSGTSNTSGTTSTANNSLGTSASSLQDTFLNLLVTELQNQDPTSPVDPTAMVGQMVSLNQLDQLMSINTTLDNIAGSATGTSSSTQSPTTTNPMLASALGGSTGSTSSANPRLAGSTGVSQTQPVYTPTTDPNALMNLYGSFAAPAMTSIPTLQGGR